jgi:radical SAM protein with 4Fe4S-binding SPASM domain
MRALNRWRLLWAYLRRKTRLAALPVEYIVETTAKCNLYCPMCPREIYRQPKEDMAEEIFRRLVAEAAPAAEHMMLIGLGEPLLDERIFDRIEYCARHGIATLLSTNGTLLDERAAARLLDSPLEHVTLSFDGARRETFEYYRKGARFEQVRENFVRFCRMKQARRSRLQIVVQMVRLERNAGEVEEFLRFWSAVPGVDLVRIKEDETRLLGPGAAHPPEHFRHPCHYLWRGPLYVKHNGEVYPCCQSYALGGRPLGRIPERSLAELWNAPEIERMRELHARGRAGEIQICSRCCTTLPHPLLAAGSLLWHGRRVRRWLPRVERLAGRLLHPPVELKASPPAAAPAPKP